jgi:hypothetical protein
MSNFDVGTVADEATTDATTSFPNGRPVSTRGPYRERNGRQYGTKQGDSSDEVDPRKLMGDPTVNELRWLYRTSLGKTLVDKPVDDAFKHGFDLEDGDEGRNYERVLDETDWVEEYMFGLKKARKDGLALTYFVLEDTTNGVGEDPLADDVVVNDVLKLETFTLDDLAWFKGEHGVLAAGDDADPLRDMEWDDYEIRPTGIVMDTDPQSATYKEPLGYLIGEPNWIDNTHPTNDVTFYHANRFQHHTVNRTSDGDLGTPTLGRFEGDSVLLSSYHLLRGLKKGNWSLMETIFRYAAKMYHVALPEDADEDDFENAETEMQNLNAKSELVTPSGYEVTDFQTDGQLQPREYFDVIFEQICASQEMTKSVLFGTQSGTVTGSETDIKNYFNKVERLRTGRVERAMRDFLTKYVRLTDSRAGENFTASFRVEWEPMFQLSELDEAERLTRTMQTLSAAINNFVLTPAEARGILREDWATADIDWEDDFSEEEENFLRSLNFAQVGAATPEAKQNALEGRGTNEEGGRNGGRERGQNQSSADPTADSTLTDTDVNRIADAVIEKQ